MAKYHQYCPVARASEIFADRWTPLIVRELLCGSQHFNEIERGLPGISRSLLVSRLRHLEDNGVIERIAAHRSNVSQYTLTEAGNALREVIEHLGAWGVKWAFGEPSTAELDPALLLWKIHQRINREELPPSRTVVQFDLSGRRGRRLWLILKPQEVSVCLKPPGFDSDLIVRANVSSLYRVWLGQTEYDAAIRCHELTVEGPPHLARAFPRWLMWSPMARFVRAFRDSRKTPDATVVLGASARSAAH